MPTYFHRIAKVIFLVSVFIFSAFSGRAQSFQGGVRNGYVKVKFSPTVTTTLNKMTANGRSKNTVTGIASVDAVAKSTSVSNMYRLFPFDEKFENKLRKHGLHLWYIVEIGEGVDPKEAVTQFKQLPEITAAEVEREKTLAPFTAQLYTPGTSTMSTLPFNDPMLKDQWHYDNTGQTGYADADINLFAAWTKTAGANDIIVAVHDQGVDVNHKDLKANIWVNEAEANGAPGVDDDNNGYVDDVNGYNFASRKGAVDPQFHATHVAGTIAAVNNNGIGVSGIAGGSGNNDGVKIMSLQIFGDARTERTFVYAANNGAVISQNSWGYTEPGAYEQSVLDAIDYFIAEAGDYPGSPMKGGIVIFAAGNSNYDGDWYPGYHPNCLTVASLGPEWKKASYSNFGDWVEVSAPGGDQSTYGAKNGVLSTYPKDQYAYLQGTSMACPHVSGIAALALANRDHQLTNNELWNKLVTGVVGIDQYNPDYIGKLGSGALDAALAIQNDQRIAPLAITNLAVTGIAQEFATLAWTVPTDTDDDTPLTFEVYHHTEPITFGNLSAATKVIIKNEKAAGEEYSYEVAGLLGVTTYYFAITSTDRWGNISLLSNVVTETTNQGPAIAIDANSQSISLELDAAVSSSVSHNITILNEASGILRWDNFIRHTGTALSFNTAGLNYPVVMKNKASLEVKVSMRNAQDSKTKLRSAEPAPAAYSPIEKSYVSWVTNIVGETDTTLTNSAAARFFVNEEAGFNLTQAQMYLKHNPAKGPVIVEVYKGSSPTKNNLIYAQEHNNYGTDEEMAYITLDEQLYFEAGSTFWLAFHVPSGNLFPLGIGYESAPSYSANCFMSFDMGSTWAPLEDLLGSEDFAWGVTAASYNQYLGTYLTLEPGAGDVEGNGEVITTLTADGSALINGSYGANVVLTSNDPDHKELRIPVSLAVSGHLPKIKHIDIADYGNVFQGATKTLELVLENEGYGNFNDPVFTFSNPMFSVEGSAPWQIGAREEVVLSVKFTPTTLGNINGVLEFSNGNQTYQISLFGVGVETSKISVTPDSQVISNVTIGDVVNAQLTVENTGAYPLKYFIPGFDSKGVSDNWPADYHVYGYKVRSNQSTEANPIPYAFQDIKSTGIDITSQINSDFKYYTLDMGFDFPYYGEKMQTLYVAQKGFTTFDNTINPINSPSLNNIYNPRGYISPLGGYFSYLTQGQIFYQVEADRVIIQYDNVWDGYNPETITAQMILFANGDIRFYYDNMGYSQYNQQGLSILIEDYNREDGILLNSWNKPMELFSGLAIGFDYPGPDLITNIENGSGIVAPGNSAVINITMKTDSLAEGIVNRYINVISNDPSKPQANPLVQLEINAGGVAEATISADTIIFGNVFQGAVKSSMVTIKNTGTANVDITSMTFVNNDFTLVGDQPASIKPGLYKNYDVQVPTASLATLEDWLSVNYADGSHDTLYITAHIVDAPGINVDLSQLQQTMAYGDSVSVPFVIENTGLATLEVTTAGKQWLSFDAPVQTNDITYTYEKENTGDIYHWIDIRKTGTQLPFVDFDDFNNTFWRKVKLPFAFEFYGIKYDSFKIGDNGIISFEENPEPSFFTDYIPTPQYSGACIMPYWTFSGFSDYLFAKEDIGIFHQAYDDKYIITWSYFVNNFGGMGDPVSAQVIFYKNGTMKFQYKAEEGGADLTSHFSTIGLQKDSANGVAISNYLDLDYGQGLAYVIVPARKLSIAPSSSLAGVINLDARNVYGGVYNEMLKIQTNVPGSEHLEKPVELTVTGDALFAAPETVDFGNKMITFEYGNSVANYHDVSISNDGSAPLEVSWLKMTDGTQALSLQVWALVDGWFGKEWRWTDISELYSPWAFQTPVYKIFPGDKLKARASFAPVLAGEYADDLVLTTTLGEKIIALKGTGFEPPVIHVTTTPVNVTMNTLTETIDRTIEFNNLNGKSDLMYHVSIDYGRVNPNPASTEAMAGSAQENAMLSMVKAGREPVSGIASSYNRTLKHTQKDLADGHAGTGGGSPLTVATKYNAGPEGFNLSHVETWFRTEALDQGTIHVEIRAGGSSIANAASLTEADFDFIGSGDDETGSFHQVALKAPVGIYPNEDFYILITVPSGISRPVGVVNDEATIAGRYYYEDSGSWFDIQEVSGFETSGWLMYAAEETAGNSAWLSITSDVHGSLGKENTSAINIHFDGAYATRGDQVAKIVMTSNDPLHPVVTVPVKLHLNEAPRFVDAPETIVVAEAERKTITIHVEDPENNTVEVTAAESYKGVSYSFANGLLSVTVAPNYGDAGTYAYTFIATDQFEAKHQVIIPVAITHTNRVPIYSGATEPFKDQQKGMYMEYVISDFFKDEDGDKISFTAVSADATIVSIFSSDNKFVIQTLTSGQTELTFTVKDEFGASLTKTLPASVKPNAAPIYIGDSERFKNYQRGIYKEYLISDFFKDDDGDKINFTAISADATIISVFSSDNKFVIQPLTSGQTELTFTVKDVYGATLVKTLPASVKPNSAPVVLKALDDLATHNKDRATTVSIANVFHDEDGDVMVYTASSADSKISSVTLTGTQLTITPMSVGETVISITATDTYGASVTDAMLVSVTIILGDINSNNLISDIIVSPNPAKNQIKIFIPEAAEGHIQVLNYLGATLQTQPVISGQDTYYIDLEAEASGVYLIEVTDGRGKTVKRVIKN